MIQNPYCPPTPFGISINYYHTCLNIVLSSHPPLRRVANAVGVIALAILSFIPVGIVDVLISVPLLAIQKIQDRCRHRAPLPPPDDPIRRRNIEAPLHRDNSYRSSAFAARSEVAPPSTSSAAASSIDRPSSSSFQNPENFDAALFLERLNRLRAFQDSRSPAPIESEEEDSPHPSDSAPSSESDHIETPRRRVPFPSWRGAGGFGFLPSSDSSKSRVNRLRDDHFDEGGSSDRESSSSSGSVDSEDLSPINRSAARLAPSQKGSQGGDAYSPDDSDEDAFTFLDRESSTAHSGRNGNPSGAPLYPSQNFGPIQPKPSRHSAPLSAKGPSAPSSSSVRKRPDSDQKTNTQLPKQLTGEEIAKILKVERGANLLFQDADSKEWLSKAIENGITKQEKPEEIALQFSSWDPGSSDLDIFKAFGAWCLVQVLRECHTELNSHRPLPAFLAGFSDRKFGKRSLTLRQIMIEFSKPYSSKWTLENKAHMILCIEKLQPDLYSQDGVSNEVASYILSIGSEAHQGNQPFFEAYSKVYPQI